VHSSAGIYIQACRIVYLCEKFAGFHRLEMLLSVLQQHVLVQMQIYIKHAGYFMHMLRPWLRLADSTAPICPAISYVGILAQNSA